jgi:glycosyltransferase involved in cell wall biosynthesis
MEGGLRTRGIFKKDKKDGPLVTIITVVYNRKTYLEQAILSVLNQNYKNIEYLIIDGGSTDGTLEIIKKYEERLDYWVSEPDNGIYHAMNKGILMANGEIIGILNSDDFYFQDTLMTIVEKNRQKGIGIYHGNQLNFVEYKDYCHFQYNKPNINDMFVKPSIFHPTCFVHKDVYKIIGLYDEKYQIIADYDFLLRALENSIPFIYIDSTLTAFRSGGKSGSIKSWIESFHLIKDHPSHTANFFFILSTIIKILIKRLISSVIGYDKMLYEKRKEL